MSSLPQTLQERLEPPKKRRLIYRQQWEELTKGLNLQNVPPFFTPMELAMQAGDVNTLPSVMQYLGASHPDEEFVVAGDDDITIQDRVDTFFKGLGRVTEYGSMFAGSAPEGLALGARLVKDIGVVGKPLLDLVRGTAKSAAELVLPINPFSNDVVSEWRRKQEAAKQLGELGLDLVTVGGWREAIDPRTGEFQNDLATAVRRTIEGGISNLFLGQETKLLKEAQTPEEVDNALALAGFGALQSLPFWVTEGLAATFRGGVYRVAAKAAARKRGLKSIPPAKSAVIATLDTGVKGELMEAAAQVLDGLPQALAEKYGPQLPKERSKVVDMTQNVVAVDASPLAKSVEEMEKANAAAQQVLKSGLARKVILSAEEMQEVLSQIIDPDMLALAAAIKPQPSKMLDVNRLTVDAVVASVMDNPEKMAKLNAIAAAKVAAGLLPENTTGKELLGLMQDSATESAKLLHELSEVQKTLMAVEPVEVDDALSLIHRAGGMRALWLRMKEAAGNRLDLFREAMTTLSMRKQVDRQMVVRNTLLAKLNKEVDTDYAARLADDPTLRGLDKLVFVSSEELQDLVKQAPKSPMPHLVLKGGDPYAGVPLDQVPIAAKFAVARLRDDKDYLARMAGVMKIEDRRIPDQQILKDLQRMYPGWDLMPEEELRAKLAGTALEQYTDKLISLRETAGKEVGNQAKLASWAYTASYAAQALHAGFSLTNIRTAVRNMLSGGINAALDVVDRALVGALFMLDLRQPLGLELLQDAAEMAKNWGADFSRDLDRVLLEYPSLKRQGMSLNLPLELDIPKAVADTLTQQQKNLIVSARKAGAIASIANAYGDYVIRRMAVATRLEHNLAKMGFRSIIDADGSKISRIEVARQAIGIPESEEMLRSALYDAMDYGMSVTFTERPFEGTLAHETIKLMNRYPILKMVTTDFPRFLHNSITWFMDHQVVHGFNMLSPEFRKYLNSPDPLIREDAIRVLMDSAGGAVLMGLANKLLDTNPTKYYMIRGADNSDYDLRFMGPLTSFMFIEYLNRVSEGKAEFNLTPDEVFSAFTGLRGLRDQPATSLETISRQISRAREEGTHEALKEVVDDWLGSLTRAYSMPLHQLRDIGRLIAKTFQSEDSWFGSTETLGLRVDPGPGRAISTLPVSPATMDTIKKAVSNDPEEFGFLPDFLGDEMYEGVHGVGNLWFQMMVGIPRIKRSKLQTALAEMGANTQEYLPEYYSPTVRRAYARTVSEFFRQPALQGKEPAAAVQHIYNKLNPWHLDVKPDLSGSIGDFVASMISNEAIKKAWTNEFKRYASAYGYDFTDENVDNLIMIREVFPAVIDYADNATQVHHQILAMYPQYLAAWLKTRHVRLPSKVIEAAKDLQRGMEFTKPEALK